MLLQPIPGVDGFSDIVFISLRAINNVDPVVHKLFKTKNPYRSKDLFVVPPVPKLREKQGLYFLLRISMSISGLSIIFWINILLFILLMNLSRYKASSFEVTSFCRTRFQSFAILVKLVLK
jgi:hypothetical protein